MWSGLWPWSRGPGEAAEPRSPSLAAAVSSSSRRAEGYRVILLNSNPATIMTDPETADATYVGPMTPELVEPILAKVRAAEAEREREGGRGRGGEEKQKRGRHIGPQGDMSRGTRGMGHGGRGVSTGARAAGEVAVRGPRGRGRGAARSRRGAWSPLPNARSLRSSSDVLFGRFFFDRRLLRSSRSARFLCFSADRSPLPAMAPRPLPSPLPAPSRSRSRVSLSLFVAHPFSFTPCFLFFSMLNGSRLSLHPLVSAGASGCDSSYDGWSDRIEPCQGSF